MIASVRSYQLLRRAKARQCVDRYVRRRDVVAGCFAYASQRVFRSRISESNHGEQFKPDFAPGMESPTLFIASFNSAGY